MCAFMYRFLFSGWLWQIYIIKKIIIQIQVTRLSQQYIITCTKPEPIFLSVSLGVYFVFESLSEKWLYPLVD